MLWSMMRPQDAQVLTVSDAAPVWESPVQVRVRVPEPARVSVAMVPSVERVQAVVVDQAQVGVSAQAVRESALAPVQCWKRGSLPQLCRSWVVARAVCRCGNRRAAQRGRAERVRR